MSQVSIKEDLRRQKKRWIKTELSRLAARVGVTVTRVRLESISEALSSMGTQPLARAFRTATTQGTFPSVGRLKQLAYGPMASCENADAYKIFVMPQPPENPLTDEDLANLDACLKSIAARAGANRRVGNGYGHGNEPTGHSSSVQEVSKSNALQQLATDGGRAEDVCEACKALGQRLAPQRD